MINFLENKKFQKIAHIISMVLSIFMIVMMIIVTCHTSKANHIVRTVLGICIFLYTMWYAIYAYKRPHGKDMKNLILIFATFISVVALLVDDGLNRGSTWGFTVNSICLVVSAVLAAYSAGRLKKLNENKIMFIIIFGLLLVGAIMQCCTSYSSPATKTAINELVQVASTTEKTKDSFWGLKVTDFWPVVMWFTIFIAYISKYNEHRKAKFDDEAKKSVFDED